MLEPIYLVDFPPSMSSYKMAIEKYYKGIKKGEFNEDHTSRDLN